MRALAASLAALACPAAASAQAAPWRATSAEEAPPREDAVVEFNTPGPGRLRLRLESAGRPQRVVVERRRNDDVTWSRRAPRNLLGSGACATPCELYVPPGPLTLRAEAPGLRGADARFDMPAWDARLRVRAPSQSLWNLGIGMVAVGATVFVAVAGLAFASQTSSGEGVPTGTAVGACLAAGALLAGGIPLLVVNASGVASIGPLGAQR